jgi:hypothetical protein
VNTLPRMRGEFTLVYQYIDQIIIVTSMIGAMHYFYYHDGTCFAHSEHIIDIIRRLDLTWVWDWTSLGDLCEQENLTENRTLHRMIKRVPPGSVLEYQETVSIKTTNYLDSLKVSHSEPIDAIKILNNETLKWVTANPYLSLSGGFDSRVILSSMLCQDIYPTVVTVGSSESSDVRVASRIANTYGLKHIIVTLSLEDMLANAEHIAKITNGSKPACHWHTFLYPKKAKVPKDESFFVGTLGEFARSYYFDKGILALLADASPKYLQRQFWQAKLTRHRTFKSEEAGGLCFELRNQISVEGIKKRAIRNANQSHGEFLAGGTRYYLEQRVPNFYANGIRMYNDTSLWRSPFHNLNWLSLIWNLSDNWKLGSNWHRLAIERNYASLLNFPEEKGLSHSRMLKRAPLFYWNSKMQRMKYKTYDLSQSWYSSDQVRSVILDCHDLISDVIDKRLCEEIIDEHRSRQARTRAISFILTILYFKKALSRVDT